MKLGVNLVRVRPDRMPALAKEAEALGYESVFVPDHAVFPASFSSRYPGTPDGSFPYPYDTPLYDPWTTLTAIGLATTTIGLGTAVYLLALRHPIHTARSAVSLEHHVGPRLLLGVGVGWLTEEFVVLGIDPATRFSRTEEYATALRVLWTEDRPSFRGRHVSFDPVHFEPKPRSRPHPPLLFGGDSDGALRRALRFGDGWMSGGVAPDVDGVHRLLDRLAAVRRTLEASGELSLEQSRPFEITILHPAPTGQDVARLHELGVHRLVVMPWKHPRDAADSLERLLSTARDHAPIEGPERSG
jgi:probable F420-dependent oxidoreductase